jgi:hypothetical protein
MTLTGGEYATVLAGDDDVWSDDYTGVEVMYELLPNSNRTGVDLYLAMKVTELLGDKRPQNTVIFTRRLFDSVYTLEQGDKRRIAKIGAPTIGRRYEIIAGTQHELVAFPGPLLLGTLRNIRVQFDGGGGDLQHQKLVCDVKFTVDIADEVQR